MVFFNKQLRLFVPVHGGGKKSKTNFVLASWHWKNSITWRWAFYIDFSKNLKFISKCIYRWQNQGGIFQFNLFWMNFALSWQKNMFRTI